MLVPPAESDIMAARRPERRAEGERADVSFRYYLYISDSKVDMLLGQIDPALTRKRTSELTVNLKVFGAMRGVESPAGADRTARLERVVRHLEDHGDLGSVDEPGQFFWGLLPMRWGSFNGTSLVYFGGHTDRTTVALGGSARHVLGSPAGGPDVPGLSPSLMPSMLAGLAAGTEEADALDGGPEQADAAALRTIQLTSRKLRGPAENVEFVAKRLLHGPSSDGDGTSVLLGSPLYVALVD
jgi:hypothetical protein